MSPFNGIINKARGEVLVTLGGKETVLCLTLKAVATLEETLGISGFSEIAGKVTQLSSQEILSILNILRVNPHIELSDNISLSESLKALVMVFQAAGD